MGCLNGKKTQILIAHHKQTIDQTKKVRLANKKSSASRQKKFGQRLENFVHIFGKFTTPYGMFEWKKNSNSYCSSEGRNRLNPKKFPSRQKKFGQGLEDFAPIFGKLTTPSVMFESKKLKFLLLIRRKKQIEPKKVQLFRKKSSARVQSILHLFLGS